MSLVLVAAPVAFSILANPAALKTVTALVTMVIFVVVAAEVVLVVIGKAVLGILVLAILVAEVVSMANRRGGSGGLRELSARGGSSGHCYPDKSSGLGNHNSPSDHGYLSGRRGQGGPRGHW